MRPPRRLALPGATLFLATVASAPVLACSVCYGSEAVASPLIDAARLGVFVLLGITAALLGGFVRFFVHLKKRAQAAESEGIASEWAQLQRSAPL